MLGSVRTTYSALIMTVLPIPSIPQYQAKYLGNAPTAGLVVLDRPKRVLPPAGTEGNGLPPDRISPNSGIYDASGKLPKTPGPGTTFMAKV
jgi:hypothetical protein